MSAAVRLIVEAPRARLVLDRPDKRNALSLEMWAAIPRLLADAAGDPAVRLLVIEGAGAHFAAGADIDEFETAYPTREAALRNQATMSAAMAAIEDFPLPTAAAIRGVCVGGGCGLALCADMRFAESAARFGITPAKLGLAYGVADTRRLVQAVGLSRAKDILFTGRIMDAAEAFAIGLVDSVDPDLAATVARFEAMICAASGSTARATKRVLRIIRDGETTDTDESRALFADAFDGADFREGVAAFRGKRAPDFGGAG